MSSALENKVVNLIFEIYFLSKMLKKIFYIVFVYISKKYADNVLVFFRANFESSTDFVLLVNERDWPFCYHFSYRWTFELLAVWSYDE